MINKILISAVIIFFSLQASAQLPDSPFLKVEADLKESFTQLYAADNDHSRDSLNKIIIQKFSETLRNPQSMVFPWDALNMIGNVHSGDLKVNIYTWYTQNAKGVYSYYGFIQYNKGSRKRPEIVLYDLADKTKGMKNPETLQLKPENWLGCVYFRLYNFEYQKNTYYTLLGYNFNTDFSDKKYIEVLQFDEDGKASFGGEFKTEFQTVKRLILEYSSEVVMNIRYDEKLQMLVLDHLSPFEEMFTGNYRFYGPDGSYDGYKFQKGQFVLQKDVDARNSK